MPMIHRAMTNELLTLTNEYPVVTILGPRQAGKTTLAQKGLPNYAYSKLESPETRELAQTDPKAYLAQFPSRTIIDEIQRVPELLSYIQVIVDQEQQNGRFILTGSHQLQVREAITQSLAGRTRHPPAGPLPTGTGSRCLFQQIRSSCAPPFSCLRREPGEHRRFAGGRIACV